MKRTRRDLLRNASTLSAVLAGLGAAGAATAQTPPEWDPDTVYTSGDRVAYDGAVWEAQWWTQGDEPVVGSGPWEQVDDGGEDPGEYPEWDPDAVYTGGDRVVHDGYVWEASWWTQGDEPGASDWGPWEQVEEHDPPDGPTASFAVSPSEPEPGEDVTFDGSDSEGTIESYEWDLGDGTTATGEVVEHAYDGEGEYEVTLTVTDADARSDDATETVPVEAAEPPEGPTAVADASPAEAEPGETVTFDGSDSEGAIESYAWELGDGTEVEGDVVEHAYDDEGEYEAALTVTDADGNEDADAVTVTVGDAPAPGPGLPENVFAPYHHMNTLPEEPPAVWAEDAGTPYFHLGFVLSGPNETPAWDNDPDYVVGESEFEAQISELQAAGGQAIISYGGATGHYLAEDFDDPEALADAYEFVADTYDTPHIDVDDEGGASQVIDRRNEALSILQDRRPDVEVSYTVRCYVGGIADIHIIDSAIEHGVDIKWVNLMTMNFGDRPSAENCIETAEGAHEQLAERLPEKSDDELYSMLGITPMIGQQNAQGAFYPDDAEAVLDYAVEQDIGLLSFWSVERDNPGPQGEVSPVHSGIDQAEFEFSHVFNAFTP